MINVDFYTDYEDSEKLEKYNKFLNDYRERIIKIVEQALKLNNIDIKNVYLGIGIVTESEIHRLNKEHRNVDRATDVLSFPMFERNEINKICDIYKSDEEISIGDIVICLDVIERQAEEYSTGFNREMLYMVTHGVCHLIGYDHIEDDDKLEMRKMEEEILLRVGDV